MTQQKKYREIVIDRNDYLTIKFRGTIKEAGNWYGDASTMREKLRSRPAAPAPLDKTISKLLSENARIGAELRRAQQEITKLNGEHDAAIAKAAPEQCPYWRCCMARSR